MTEHPEFALLDEFVLGTLSAADAKHVSGHLATCAVCRMECDALRSVIDVLPHSLPAGPAPAALRDRIFAAIDAPAPSESAPQRRPSISLVRGLAAALLLALAGDGYFALRAAQRVDVAVVSPTAEPTPRPAASLAPVPPTIVPRPTVLPRPTVTPRPTVLVPTAAPTPAAPASAPVARLERELHAARAATTAAEQRIRQLQVALATARVRPRVVTILVTPAPTAAPPASTPTDGAALVAALRTGKVYTLDGDVDSEPWHLTIVQPRDGAHALLYSGTPDAPSGQTYRSWVLRDGQTVSIGELPPGKPATIEMPMALQAGDIVAFSREPLGSGDLPTTKFLMELKVAP